MRDTVKDWGKIAESAPYYGVITLDKYINPDEEILNDFFNTGGEYVSQEIDYIQNIWPDFAPKSVLDFGCGVGRLAIPLSQFAGMGVGIDVADKMRELARFHAQNAGAPLEVLEAIPEGRVFDWVNSFIVFQHIVPERGYPLIAKLWDATAPNGIFAIQVTTYKDVQMRNAIAGEVELFRYDGARIEVFNASSLDIGHISMFDYDLGRVLSILDLPYGHLVSLKKTNHGGCHGFHIYVRKPNA